MECAFSRLRGNRRCTCRTRWRSTRTRSVTDRPGAVIYLCGDASRMAPDVEEACALYREGMKLPSRRPGRGWSSSRHETLLWSTSRPRTDALSPGVGRTAYSEECHSDENQQPDPARISALPLAGLMGWGLLTSGSNLAPGKSAPASPLNLHLTFDQPLPGLPLTCCRINLHLSWIYTAWRQRRIKACYPILRFPPPVGAERLGLGIASPSTTPPRPSSSTTGPLPP